MKLSIVISLGFFCLSVRPSVYAQETAGLQKEIPQKISISTDTTKLLNGYSLLDEIEIDRLIVDETISKAGYDFIELFNTQWNWPEPLTEAFIMVIAERPYRGISTQVVITVNDLVVFESFLQTRYDYLENLAELAIEQTTAYIINYEEIIKQLEAADTQGTGIY
jgi:curli production assembly/transport component CsgE